MKLSPLEERVYRLRCVEAWSMVIPWIGFPLSALIKSVEPTNNAKFIHFVTLQDPKRMPGQQPGLFGSVLEWPYVEGLRMDEAMHPLTILSVGSLRRNLAGAKWRAGSLDRAVEVRFQEHQVDRESALCRKTAAGVVEHYAAARVRLLLQRQSGSRPSALEPSHRTTHRRIFAPQNS